MNLVVYICGGAGLLLILAVSIVSSSLLFFTGADHSQYDSDPPPPPPPAAARGDESPEHVALRETMLAEQAKPGPSGREFITAMRVKLDERGAAIATNARFFPVDANGVAAEWALAPDARPGRRILYLHGGGYVMGSPRSHRPITARLSGLARAAVLAVDYRLMPEYSRRAGIDDCRAAYEWLIKNGPPDETSNALETLIVAGDSSGGNLALSTIAWARDRDLRAAEAVVVMSPQTDATLGSPSLRKNAGTDVMQGASFGPIVRAPRAISLWFSYLFIAGRINPRDPDVSPLLGDLANLPPTLIQVSGSEMFLDDAVRYANKAQSQASPVVLQVWPHTLHVWQAFDVPEANAAFAGIDAFLAKHAP